MKIAIKLSVCFTLLLSSSIYADEIVTKILTDGTVGAIKDLSGKNVEIPQNLGTTMYDANHTPVNLFHSFTTFNIGTGDTVKFTGDAALKNVISRVTGIDVVNGNNLQPSIINGLLKSEVGNANFYFINPAGVTFGANAHVDVPAAFHVSTANQINFKDDSVYSATNPSASTLTIAEPANFGFLTNQAADIKIQGSTLDFNYANAVSLNAGNIVINHGILSNPSGTITINAQKSVLLSNSSGMNVSTESSSRGGNIAVTASSVTVDNSFIRSNTRSTGDAGTITVNSDKLLVQNGGQIGSSTSATGNAGLITIQTKTLEVIGDNGIHTTDISTNAESGSTGTGGVITVTSDTIYLDNLGLIDSNTSGTGDAGSVSVTSSEQIIIANDAHISSSTKGVGDAGKVAITANLLSVNHGHIHTVGFDGSIGNAGETTIQAKEFIISNGGIVHADAKPGAKGNAGSVTVNSDKLVLESGGEISSSAYSVGTAGDVIVQAKTIDIQGEGISSITRQNVYSQISAAATDTSSGQTGIVKVTADKAIHLYDGGMISIQNDAKANTTTTKSGTLSVFAPEITLDNGGTITAKSTGNVDAGHIAVSFSHWLTMDGKDSAITTQANTSNGGNVTIKGGELINLQNNAHIDTYTATGGKGGDIKINADTLVMNTAKIIAQADNASNGGDVSLTLNALIPSHNQLQVDGKPLANSEIGGAVLNVIQAARSGGVTLNAPQFNISGSIGTLNRTIIEPPDLDRNNCNTTAAYGSSLSHGGKGGIPVNEAKTGVIPSASVLPNAKINSEKNSFHTKPMDTNAIKSKKNYLCAAEPL